MTALTDSPVQNREVSAIMPPNRVINMSTGPVEVSKQVLAAQLADLLTPHSEQFWHIHDTTRGLLGRILRTDGRVLMMHGSIRTAVDVALANAIKPGNKVLCIVNGYWGELIAKWAEQYQAKVTRLTHGLIEPIDIQRVADALKADHYDMVTLVHVETNSGIVNPVQEVGRLVANTPTLFFVDSACSAGAMQIETDRWNVDIQTTGSHKCLASIPGLAIISLSDNGTPPYERNLGVVFQQYALFPHLTVRRNVAFPLEIRRMRATEREKLVDDAIAMVDLKSFETRYPAELSGGQQQRVALARALVYSPPVLLLDEPLGALDRRLRDAMQAELMDLHKRLGKTFVYVTHDQDEALAMSDRVVVMRNGLIEQHGTPLELYERPRNAFVAKFVGECNVLTGDWVQVGSSWRVIHQPTGVVLHETSKTPTSGSTASVAIRPEWLSVGTPSGKGSVSSGAVACRVMQTRFHGSDTLLNVQSGLGELLVRLPHQMRATLDLSKDELSVFWTASESVLLDS